jgi:hypothetical protein
MTISRLDIPLMIIRTQGNSDIVKYARAMIAFTKTAAAVIPANHYAKGIQQGAAIADSFFDVLAGNSVSRDKYDAAFQLNATLGRRNTGCTPQDLHDNMQAKIQDYTKGDLTNIIKTSETGKYCFYKVGTEDDPDIGYVDRPASGICANAVPAPFRILNNPQVIFMAWGVPPSEVKVATAVGSSGGFSQLLPGEAWHPSLPIGKSLKASTPSLKRAAQICLSAKLTYDTCFAPEIANYLRRAK